MTWYLCLAGMFSLAYPSIRKVHLIQQIAIFSLHKLGYSGVAIYTRSATCAPIRAEEGITGVLTQAKSGIRFRDLPADQQIGGYPSPDQLPDLVDEETLDSEGRCVILEFPGFVLIGVYSPANRDETRDDFRISFVEVLDARIRNLVNAGKQVILTGDLNIVRSEIDSSNVAENLRKEGMSIEEWRNMPARRIFNQLIFEGQVHGSKDSGREAPVLWDICRCFHPTRQGMNTCWDVRKNTRPANYGSRIDYVLCSDGLKSWVTASNIQEGLMGSDHCPVFATIADRVQFGNKEVSVLEAMNPPGMFVDGKRQRDWSQKDLLPLSARFIPEFDGRRSIRDMFQKKNVAPTPKVQPRPAMDPGNTPFDAEAMPRKEIDKIKLKSPEHVLADASSLVERAEQPIMTGSPTKQVASSKRGADSPIAPSKKRGRLVPEASSSGTKAKTAPGQQTLQGFFKPKSTASTPGTEANGNAATGESNTPQPTAPAVTSAERIDPPPNFGEVETGQAPIDDILESSPTVFDPIVAKESWSKLLGKRVVPRCEHNEPCISQLTKKPGVNCGMRLFPC